MLRRLLRSLSSIPVAVLAHFGLVEERRGERTVALAWPRVLTGFARQSQHAADLAMVGLVIGPAAIAGLAFARPFWSVASGIGTGLANGAIVLISQRFGAEEYAELDVALKQSFVVSILVPVPIVILYWFSAADLVGLLGASPAATEYGATYLQVTAIALLFKFPNKVAGRALVGVDDARTPMLIRAGGAVLNIALNAIFIFGFGLGVLGAALGTLLSSVAVTASFGWGLLLGRHPGIGEFPLQVHLRRPYLDLALGRQLIVISVPLMARRLSDRAARFPMLAIVSSFGTVVVAAYQISRQVRTLMNIPNWGLGLAASSLVGQELGRGEEAEASAFGWDILRMALVVYLATTVVVFVFARPITLAFIQDAQTVDTAVTFVRVAAVSAVGLGIDGVATGTLRAGGDTRWPLYGRIVGLYAFTLPFAYLALVTPLGIVALYLALMTETYVPAAVTFYRLRSGRWRVMSRAYRPGASG